MLRLHFVEKMPVSDICEEYRLNPNVFYRWQKEFFENGARAFEHKRSSKVDEKDRKIQELERKLADRDEGIVELMMEHVLLKKAWPKLKGRWVEPDTRDAVVDFVKRWSSRFTVVSAAMILKRLSLSQGKFYEWKKRYGRDNQHNGKIPRISWLLPEEKDAIVRFYLNHRHDGYRRCAYMMIDQDIAYCSPSTVYRVLREYDVLRRWNRKTSTKGDGFKQPTAPHSHWHIDISYLRLGNTFYDLISILDGYSRFIVHWDIREQMASHDVLLVLQRAHELYPQSHPRIISDNGSQFISRDFKELICLHGMSHVRTSPYYPQSNSKQERWHKTLKSECIRPGCPLNLKDARRLVAHDVDQYNNHRLHSAIGYVTPRAMLEQRAEEILRERDRKLEHW